MSIEDTIQNIREVVAEWDAAGMDSWLENHTRYGVIDPIIRALGWNIADPKECHPEYPRPFPSGLVDYAFFHGLSADDIGSGQTPPVMIIESKALREDLADHVEQLKNYVAASPVMRDGVAVLTNGNEWWIYDLEQSGSFDAKLVCSIDIISGKPRESARLLHRWLRKR